MIIAGGLTLSGCSYHVERNLESEGTAAKPNHYVLLVGGIREDNLQNTLHPGTRAWDTLLSHYGSEGLLRERLPNVMSYEDRLFRTLADLYGIKLDQVPDENMTILYADGIVDENNSLPNDYAELPHVKAARNKVKPLSRGSLTESLEALAKTSAHDLVDVILVSHGLYLDGHSYLSMNGPPRPEAGALEDEAFWDMMASIPACKLVTIDACYSGGFANEKYLPTNTVVWTAADTLHEGNLSSINSYSKEVTKAMLDCGVPFQAHRAAQAKTLWIPSLPSLLEEPNNEGRYCFFSESHPQIASNPPELHYQLIR